MKTHFTDSGEIAHAAIADQTDPAAPGEDGRHHFTRVRGTIAIAADFLQHDDGGFRRALHRLEQLDERFFRFRSAERHGFRLRGYGVAAHGSELREQAFQIERGVAFRTRAQVQQLDRVGEGGRIDGLQKCDQL